jgi:hypothetical protein
VYRDGDRNTASRFDNSTMKIVEDVIGTTKKTTFIIDYDLYNVTANVKGNSEPDFYFALYDPNGVQLDVKTIFVVRGRGSCLFQGHQNLQLPIGSDILRLISSFMITQSRLDGEIAPC